MSKRFRLFGRRADEGGVAVTVGILLASGVLLGMTALAVDVGQLYAEREELQSGADGVATAVSLACARQTIDCADNGALATKYGNGNALDNRTDVTEICGSAPGVSSTNLLPDCVPGLYPDNLTDCIGEIPANSRGWVQVHTSTERDTASDRYILPYSFAQSLTGSKGATVGACARVAWGTPLSGVAVTFCTAEFNASTGDGTDLAPAPPAIPDDSYEKTLIIQSGNGNSGGNNGGGNNGGYNGNCSHGPSGWDLPGDFGFTDAQDGTCMTLLSQLYYPKPGNAADNTQICRDFFASARANRTPIGIPIFSLASGTGNNGQYQLDGIAAFVITGYDLTNIGRAESTLTQAECPQNEKCLMGYFTRAITSLEDWNGEFGSVPSFGASIIKTVG
ncbi:MAG: hypothetical protein HOV71_02085 [Hamadaea sp.]|nr:hypothetical protein [Hamadaea sp.]NUR46902.1 hypothetical protein [Hamadaea sp.]NUT07930.1 hypothetical protein [Hamadaea sp.]